MKDDSDKGLALEERSSDAFRALMDYEGDDYDRLSRLWDAHEAADKAFHSWGFGE